MRSYQRAGRAKGGAAVLFLFFAGAALISAAGCGGGSGVRHFFSKHYVKISPGKTEVPPGQTRFFQAESVKENAQRFRWKVKEGDAGGTVAVVQETYLTDTSQNQYTAPQTPGTYHVEVAADYPNGDTEKATATIEVK